MIQQACCTCKVEADVLCCGATLNAFVGHSQIQFQSRRHQLCSCSLLFCQSCIADAELVDVQADKSRVKDYINRLDNFDGPAVGEIAVGYEMFEEAFEIYKKFGLKSQAIKVLLDHQNDLDRAFEYAGKVGSLLHILTLSQCRVT